ncbi:hypothetical protein BGZ70_009750 [Mortierella alpina]|uniref:Uncharacterized protein n=1 Tax=Mortierella alpina TaxID=64518 RepID=A0A9P6J0M3_MORAP|nr:hypothetical protein BGZ70_009750 [Mortierella alpina]
MERKELYQFAHDKLLENCKIKDKGKNKKEQTNSIMWTKAYCKRQKQLAALSGIVNTISPSAKSFAFTPEMKVESAVAALEEKDDALTELMDELLESYCPGHKDDPLAPLDLESLRLKIWSLLLNSGLTPPRTKAVRQRMAVLQVIDHVCTLIATNQLAPPTTEHVVVSVWSNIFALLLGGDIVRGIPGELASPAAKDVRLHIENEYGVTTKFVRDRKVDLSVRVLANDSWHNEICVFEFKAGSASDAVCSKQQRKAVRLNTAVLQDLEHKGVDVTQHFPIIAEGRGLRGDVMVAGRSTGRVAWIPSDQVKLKQFLKSDSLQVLLRFAHHTSRYAVYVQETLSSMQQPPLPSTPPPRFKKPFAAFTPHKHNKRRHVEEADEDADEDADEEDSS